MNKVLVCGAGGFIGSHLVTNLKNQGKNVIGVDLKYPEFSQTNADEFIIGDLRDRTFVNNVFKEEFLEVYQLAADMGGAGFIFTGNNDADIMSNSATINLNVCNAMLKSSTKKIFYASSACIYPEEKQISSKNLNLTENVAYPANPDSNYGWEKLFGEKLYESFMRNYNFDVRIARIHNVFGPEGTWNNGREKAPAAICRKIAETKNGEIEIWGSGKQTRSFLYINECITGINKLMKSTFTSPINLGSDFMISINDLAYLIADIANKNIKIKHIPGPIGVNARCSNNKLIKEVLNWSPDSNLKKGLSETYSWIYNQVV
jgi:nucleoside-diphosphate-sugar epimerase